MAENAHLPGENMANVPNSNLIALEYFDRHDRDSRKNLNYELFFVFELKCISSRVMPNQSIGSHLIASGPITLE